MTLVWLVTGLDGSGEEFKAGAGFATAAVFDPGGSPPLVPAGEFWSEPGLGGVGSAAIGAIGLVVAEEPGLPGGAAFEGVVDEEFGVEVSVSVTVGAVGAGVEVSVSVTVGAVDVVAVVVGAGVEVSVSVSVGAVDEDEVEDEVDEGVVVGGVVGVGVGVEVSVSVSVDVGVGVDGVGGGVGVGIGAGVDVGVGEGEGEEETTTTGAGADRTSVVPEPVTARSSRASSVSKSNRERDRCRRERFPGPRSSRSIHLRLGRIIPGCGERILTPWITLDVQSNGNSRATAPVGSFLLRSSGQPPSAHAVYRKPASISVKKIKFWTFICRHHS